MIGSMGPGAKGTAGVAFRRSLLLPHRRKLLTGSEAISLGARGFDVLMALVEARGEVVSKDALAARVWPPRSSRITPCSHRYRHYERPLERTAT